MDEDTGYTVEALDMDTQSVSVLRRLLKWDSRTVKIHLIREERMDIRSQDIRHAVRLALIHRTPIMQELSSITLTRGQDGQTCGQRFERTRERSPE